MNDVSSPDTINVADWRARIANDFDPEDKRDIEIMLAAYERLQSEPNRYREITHKCDKGHVFYAAVNHPAKSEAEWECPNCLSAELHALKRTSPEPRDDLIQKIGMAYGHLWHVNNEPGTPAQHSPEKAAMSARHILRDTLTHEQRGFYINAVREALQLNMSMPIDESDLDPLPFVPAGPNNEPLSHQGIFSAVNHFAREILRMTDAVTVECVPDEGKENPCPDCGHKWRQDCLHEPGWKPHETNGDKS